MPLYTEHYKLGYKLANEQPSAALDKNRALVVDNLLAFVSDIAGNGRINGWHLSSSASNVLSVESGIGIINRVVARTLGPLTHTFTSDGDYYVYMQRKPNVLAGFSDFGTRVGFTFSDTTPPSAPSSATVSTITRNSIRFVWTASVSSDVKGYQIYRKLSTDSWTGVTTPIATVTTLNYTDTDLDEQTQYDYRIRAVDDSNNISTGFTACSAMTTADSRVPTDPKGISLYVGDSTIQAAWLFSPSDYVDTYEITLQPLNAGGQADGSSTVVEVSPPTREHLFNGLTNNKKYQVTIKAKTANDVTSTGIAGDATPLANAGPSEVTAVSVSEVWDGKTLKLSVSWTPDNAIDAIDPSSYQITIVESGQYSGVVNVPSGTSKVVNVFSANGEKRKIAENTLYEIRVQGLTASKVANIGVLKSITTTLHTIPEAPTNVSVAVFQSDLLSVSWDNSTSRFDHNLLTITKTDLDTMSSTTLITESVGKSQMYVMQSPMIETNTRYTAVVKAVDIAGNQSLAATDILDIDETIPAPVSPEVVIAQPSLGCMTIRWSRAEVDNVASYKIWKASSFPLTATNFALLDTVDGDTNEVLDYDITYNTLYAYTVTTVDTFGNESEGPADSVVGPNTTLSRNKTKNPLTVPSGVAGSWSSGSFTITWNLSNEMFDGWQVYRSINADEYIQIGAVDRAVLTYVDTPTHLSHGDVVRYLVRKYRNEAVLVVSSTINNDENMIPLGTVNVSSGTVESDETDAVELENLLDPINAILTEKIKAHRHFYYNDADDRRIPLGDSVEVDDWTTLDLYTYTSEEDLSDFINAEVDVRINGVTTDILYELDFDNATLTFQQELGADDLVSIIFGDVEEITGTLPEDKIAFLDASKFTSETLDPLTLPSINHNGRIGMNLVPIREDTKTNNYQQFSRSDTATISFSEMAIVFYDVLHVEDNTVLAGTSKGIYLSTDLGHEWSLVGTTTSPVTRLFKSESNEYFAAAGNKIFVASELLTDWHELSSLTGVSFVHSFAEDSSNYVYATTDVGIFRYDPALSEKFWEQTAMPEYNSSVFYAAYYEPQIDAVVVSGEGGLFYTVDAGATWTLWSAFREPRVVFDVVIQDSVTYLLCHDRVYRKKTANTYFAQIAYEDTYFRRIECFNDRLYVTSAKGVLTSTGVIDTDSALSFSNMLPQIAEGENPMMILALRTVDDRLMLGAEKRMYVSSSHGAASLQYQQTGTVIPCVYVNDEPVTLGVYTNATGSTFDQRQSPNDTVTVTYQYSAYQIQAGGWAHIDFKAPVTMYYNASSLNTSVDTVYSDSITFDDLPELTVRNSDYTTATAIVVEIETAEALAITSPSSANVASVFQLMMQLEGYIDPSLTITRPELNATLMKSINPVATVNASDGTVTFTDNILVGGSLVGVESDPYRFTKYSKLTVDIEGITLTGGGEFSHDEIDDKLEKRLSGLDAKFAAVHQINLVKTGIYFEQEYPDERASIMPPLQTEIFTGCDMDWYDRFNSTVDYVLRVRKNPDNISLVYPSAVLDMDDLDQIWVGGFNGVVAIDKTTLTASPTVESILDTKGKLVTCMLKDTSVVYAVAESVVYKIGFTGTIEKDNATSVPSGITSVIKAHNNLLVGAADGVYIRRVSNVWERVLELEYAQVAYLGDLIIAYSTRSNKCYSSQSGEGWTYKGDPTPENATDIVINNVVRFRSVFFATVNGLYEDNMTFYAKEVGWKKANLTGELSDEISVNDIATDSNILLAGISDGRYYTYELGSNVNSFIEYDASDVLETIHKVAVINDEIWLFGFDKAFNVSQDVVIKLATGKRLTWQT